MDEKQFQKLMELVEENNHMLKQVRGVQRRAWWGSFFKMLLIIAIALGAYYLVQPFIENLSNAYNSVFTSFNSLQENASSISSFVNRNN